MAARARIQELEGAVAAEQRALPDLLTGAMAKQHAADRASYDVLIAEV